MPWGYHGIFGVKGYRLVVAATAEQNDERKDDDPGAVIVEQRAKAVVIHSVLQCS